MMTLRPLFTRTFRRQRVRSRSKVKHATSASQAAESRHTSSFPNITQTDQTDPTDHNLKEVDDTQRLSESHSERDPDLSSPPGVSDDALSQTSVDSGSEADSNAEAQLNSIPPPCTNTIDEKALDDRVSLAPSIVTETPGLLDLLRYSFDIERTLLGYLDVPDLRNLREIKPLKQIAYDFILHNVIPETFIILNTKYQDGERQSSDGEIMHPVIRRIKRSERRIPVGRIVYETDPSLDTSNRIYRWGEFHPDSIMYHVPNRYAALNWPLRAGLKSESRYSRNPRVSMRLPDPRIPTWYYIFRDEFADGISNDHSYRDRYETDYPVNVFYKRQGGSASAARLHAVSIPFETIIERLCA